MQNSYKKLIDARKKNESDSYSLIRFALAVLVIFALVIALFTFVYGGVRVDGISMQDTLHNGDYVFVNKLAEADRGDIVVVYTGRASAEYVIKRVIALEGDELYAKNGILFLKKNGEESFSVVNETYLTRVWTDGGAEMPYTFGSESDPVVVGKGEIFYMGDNRAVSYDCRAYGPQPEEHVWGVVTDWSMAIKGFLTGFFNLFATA